MPTVSTPSSRPGMALVSVPVRSSTGGISTAGAAGVLSARVPLLSSELLPPQAVRARAMVRARIALIHLLLITVSFLSGASVPHRRGMMKKMNRFAKRFMEYTENLSLENRTSPNSQ